MCETNFTIVPNQIVRCGSRLTPPELRVLLNLLSWRQKSGECWVYIGILATHCGMTERSIKRIITSMEKKRAIRVARNFSGDRKANNYEIIESFFEGDNKSTAAPELSPIEELVGDDNGVTPTGDKSVTPTGDKSVTPTGDKSVTPTGDKSVTPQVTTASPPGCHGCHPPDDKVVTQEKRIRKTSEKHDSKKNPSRGPASQADQQGVTLMVPPTPAEHQAPAPVPTATVTAAVTPAPKEIAKQMYKQALKIGIEKPRSEIEMRGIYAALLVSIKEFPGLPQVWGTICHCLYERKNFASKSLLWITKHKTELDGSVTWNWQLVARWVHEINSTALNRMIDAQLLARGIKMAEGWADKQYDELDRFLNKKMPRPQYGPDWKWNWKYAARGPRRGKYCRILTEKHGQCLVEFHDVDVADRQQDTVMKEDLVPYEQELPELPKSEAEIQHDELQEFMVGLEDE